MLGCDSMTSKFLSTGCAHAQNEHYLFMPEATLHQ